MCSNLSGLVQTKSTLNDMQVSLFHKEKWCLDKKVIYITLAVEMNENGVAQQGIYMVIKSLIIRVM